MQGRPHLVLTHISGKGIGLALLGALSEKEREELPPTIDITCHMCGRTFTVKTK